MHKIEELKNLKDRFMKIACAELDKGVECVNTNEMGEVIDMIKDLAEAEEKCMKAKYYRTVVEAMEEYEFDEEVEDMVEADEWENERRGYRGRSKSSGRYVHRGRPTRDSGSPMSMGMNRGFPYYPSMDPDDHRQWDRHRSDMVLPNYDERYGKHYNEYKDSKRRYTETKSGSDKDSMTRHARDHVQDTVDTMEEIWHDADPELRKKMKADITALLAKMN